MSKNDEFQDRSIRHAIGLRRLSTGIARDIITLLDDTETDLVAQIANVDPSESPTKAKRLKSLLRDIRKLNKNGYRKVHDMLMNDLVGLANYEAEFQTKMFSDVLNVALDDFALPSRSKLVAAVTAEPFKGRFLCEWVDGAEEGQFARVRDAIRIGFVEGESVDDIVRRVRGTRKHRYKDGVLEISRRSARAMVRTAVTHTATAARDLTYAENADVIRGWRFIATLDSRTSEICAGLDGKEFRIGEGPRPPRHINCRSTTVPVVKYGGKAERITYPQWLRNQSKEVQDENLGPTRAELWRKGEVTIDKFADDNRVYTLDELREREGL